MVLSAMLLSHLQFGTVPPALFFVTSIIIFQSCFVVVVIQRTSVWAFLCFLIRLRLCILNSRTLVVHTVILAAWDTEIRRIAV
jgi:hypothetical protein